MQHISNVAMAFNAIVDQFPEKVALYYPEEDEKVTYAELEDLAWKIASYLSSRPVAKGELVVIFQHKSPIGLAAMIACILTGVIYTNLDPESPLSRTGKILDACLPAMVFYDGVSAEFSKQISDLVASPVVSLSEVIHSADNTILKKNPAHILETDPCYVMYTSGSTGVPKGVVVSHGNLISFIKWARNRFSITENDVFTNLNPIYFDNSVFDFYVSLFSGSKLVPITSPQLKDVRRAVKLVEMAECTVWFSVPSLLVYLLTTRALLENSLPSIRKIIFGGEGFPKSKLKKLFDFYGDRADLENVYGPTECTCICSAHTIISEDFQDMSGFPTLGFLAEHFAGEILPIEPDNPDYGELLLFGPAVGLGYFQDQRRSEEVFLQNPSHTTYRDIGYKTGDIVSRDREGRLYFKGRSDFQIKHLGYRIELEEIEAALNTLPYVNECAAVYVSLTDATALIYGFIAVDAEIGHGQVIADLGNLLPRYMVPARIITLSALPKNANGKIDRAYLKENCVR
jgi:D-alanine--poly(phosphoribitol) ligase subunit 1